MDGERKSCTERILSAIEYGRLSSDETERRLCELVEAEVNKTDSEADMELIKACQSLMWQLHTHGELPYDSHYDENKAKIDQRLKRNTLVSNIAKSVGKMLAAAAAVVLVVLGLRGDLHWSWLEQINTADKQQRIIAGNEAGIELIQSAIAEYEGESWTQITGVKEVSERFSFVPIPAEINGEWYCKQAICTITPTMVNIDTMYVDAVSERSLIYSIVLFTSTDDAYLTFEQSAVGCEMEINGESVYVTDNIGRQSMCWTKGLVFVSVTGALSHEESNTVFESILEEWLH